MMGMGKQYFKFVFDIYALAINLFHHDITFVLRTNPGKINKLVVRYNADIKLLGTTQLYYAKLAMKIDA